MAAPRKSKRFNPNRLTEKIVPFVLLMLLLILVTVLVIAGLSLLGRFPFA